MKVYYDSENKNPILSKKLFVVQLYLSSEISYQDLALQEGIRNPSQIVKWVNDFRIAGPDALDLIRKVGRKHWIHLLRKRIFKRTEKAAFRERKLF